MSSPGDLLANLAHRGFGQVKLSQQVLQAGALNSTTYCAPFTNDLSDLAKEIKNLDPDRIVATFSKTKFVDVFDQLQIRLQSQGHFPLVNYTNDMLETVLVRDKDMLNVYQRVPFHRGQSSENYTLARATNIPLRHREQDVYFHMDADNVAYILNSPQSGAFQMDAKDFAKCRDTSIGYLCKRIQR